MTARCVRKKGAMPWNVSDGPRRGCRAFTLLAVVWLPVFGEGAAVDWNGNDSAKAVLARQIFGKHRRSEEAVS